MQKKVFTPVTIGNTEIKNRLVMSSMCVYYCEEDGRVSDRMFAYVSKRARGGCGLMVIPGTPHGKPSSGRPAISDDKYIPEWVKLADEVHKYGAKLFCQLHPGNLQAGRGHDLPQPAYYEKFFIEELVESYGAAALRAKKAGCDGVEITGGHAHEISQFLSPYYNKRTDEYGGDYIGRSKFGRDAVRAIKKTCGKDFPISFCINGSDMLQGGRTIEETVKIAPLLEEAGADALHILCGMPASEQYTSAPMDVEDMFNVENAAKVKAAVSIPVIAVNRIVDVAQAEKVIAEGKADLVSMARAQLADTEVINKFAGKNDMPVRRCVGCNQGCRNYKTVRCMQNPLLGSEYLYPEGKAGADTSNLKVMIAGAGPGGLEAAVTLAEYGVKPLIYEKSPYAGGLVRLAAMPPHKQNMNSITTYRLAVLDKYGIKINYETKVDKALIESVRPDVLIIATGSLPIVPRIEGLDTCRLYTGDEALCEGSVREKNIAIIGGGLIGCEVAEYLAERGKNVTVFEMKDDIAQELTLSRRVFLLERMRDKNIKTVTGAQVTGVDGGKISVIENGAEKTYADFEAIISAPGRRSDTNLTAFEDEIKSMGVKVYKIGDACKPSFALEAIYDGFCTAADIIKLK